jgi:hypothetical protein
MEEQVAEIKKGLEDLRIVVGNIPIITKESLQYRPPDSNHHIYLAEALDAIYARLNRIEEVIFDSGK